MVNHHWKTTTLWNNSTFASYHSANGSDDPLDLLRQQDNSADDAISPRDRSASHGWERRGKPEGVIPIPQRDLGDLGDLISGITEARKPEGVILGSLKGSSLFLDAIWRFWEYRGHPYGLTRYGQVGQIFRRVHSLRRVPKRRPNPAANLAVDSDRLVPYEPIRQSLVTRTWGFEAAYDRTGLARPPRRAWTKLMPIAPPDQRRGGARQSDASF
jgi:hypothetical protein